MRYLINKKRKQILIKTYQMDFFFLSFLILFASTSDNAFCSYLLLIKLKQKNLKSNHLIINGVKKNKSK